MDRGGYPTQAFAALKAAKPPATARGRERQAILIKEAGEGRTRYEWIAKHEWAKGRVCSVLRLARYDQWNGFIPPSTDQNGNPNRSTERRLLVMLTHDVERFERTGELPDYATEAVAE
jgi:hypothetical protein